MSQPNFNPSYFHRIFSIPEIGDHVCSFFDTGPDKVHPFVLGEFKEEKTNQRADLLSLLRTCRGTFYPAARRLWGSVVDARHLLPLLPSVHILDSEIVLPQAQGFHIILTDITDPLPSSYFDRFKLYAHFVKCLSIRNLLWLNEKDQAGSLFPAKALLTLQSYAEDHALLPNLRAISIQIQKTLPTEVSDLVHCSWPEILLSQSLSFLGIDCYYLTGSPLNDMHRTIATAVYKCPELKHLDFLFAAQDDHAPAFLFNTDAPALRKIHKLRCARAHLSPYFMQWLQNMPNLVDLQLYSLKQGAGGLPEPIVFPPNAFPSLANLTLTSPDANASLELFHMPIFHRLTQLVVFLYTPTNWISDQILVFFMLVANNCRGLNEFCLGTFNEPDPEYLPASHFDPLKVLPVSSLRIVSDISGHRLFGTLGQVVNGWASLHILQVSIPLCPFEYLSNILPFCQDLQALYVESFQFREATWNTVWTTPNPENLEGRPLVFVSDLSFFKSMDQVQLAMSIRYVPA